MGDEDHRVALAVDVLQHSQYLPAGAGVQGAGGLVGQNDRRTAHQGPGDGYPLLLAAGELHGLVPPLISQAHLFQGRLGPLPALSLGNAGVHQRDLHVLRQIQFGQQIILLENEAQKLVADLGQLVFVHLAHILAVQEVGSIGGDVQTADDVHAGGFAGAGGAHNGNKFPLIDLK